MGNLHVFIWLGMGIILAIIELSTLGLTSIWFSIGALITMFFALNKASIVVQILVFLIVSLVLLIFTKPIAKKHLKIGSQKTNIQELIGKHGVIIKDVSEDEFGQAKVDGKIWTVKSYSGDSIKVEEKIIVQDIEGVKLLVTKYTERED